MLALVLVMNGYGYDYDNGYGYGNGYSMESCRSNCDIFCNNKSLDKFK